MRISPYLKLTDRILALAILASALAPVPACVELQLLLTGERPGTGDGGNGNDNSSNDNDNGSGQDQIPTVRLSVSNAAPQINEEVRLTCDIVAGEESGATFAFQPSTGRLIVNAGTGIASFIVTEPDIGVSFSHTCTATNEHGTSLPSNPVTFFPTAAP